MFKKAQAAMEFLMTYGWAILVVLAAIAALAYFGVLSPDRFLPEKCTMPSGVACLDFSVNAASNSITLSLQNAAGFDMSSAALNISDLTPAGLSCTQSPMGTGSVANGQKENIVVNCTGISALSANTKIRGKISLTYTNTATTLAHEAIGEIIAKRP